MDFQFLSAAWNQPINRRKLILLFGSASVLPALMPSRRNITAAATNMIDNSDRSQPVQPKPILLSRRTIEHCVWSAEGNINPDGSKNKSYLKHIDPGNGKVNVGGYSTQNCTDSIEACNDRQYRNLQQIWTQVTQPTLKNLGIHPGLYETINLFDVANQSPACIQDANGSPVANSVMHRLAEARRRRLSERSGVEYARIWAYWDPHQRNWDAPGLRAYDHISKYESIRRDVDRRMSCIDAALDWLRQSTSTPIAFTATATAQNPYPPDQRIDYLYWQLGHWDASTDQPPRSNDPAYLQGYRSG